MIRFYLVCLPYWIFVDYIFVRLSLTYLPANNLRRISTIYIRVYLQGSENGRVVTIAICDAHFVVYAVVLSVYIRLILPLYVVVLLCVVLLALSTVPQLFTYSKKENICNRNFVLMSGAFYIMCSGFFQFSRFFVILMIIFMIAISVIFYGFSRGGSENYQCKSLFYRNRVKLMNSK